VLREYLKQAWTNELLTYPFSAPEGTCHPESVVLTGPQGQPDPVQLSDIEYWPNTKAVKSAKLSFLANLAPLATDSYTVSYGNQPVPAAPLATDLTVTPGKEQVEIVTKQFGARLLLGEQTYATPVASSQVPGPVVALRLADGTWFGASRLFGNQKVAGYSARLVARGPVFSQVEFVYRYADGNRMRLLAEIAAGDNAILWDAAVTEDAPRDGWDLLLSPGLPPLVFRVYMEFWPRRKAFLAQAAKVGDLAELRLDEYPPGLITNLTPFPDWWNEFTQTTIPLKLTDRDCDLLISSRDAGLWVTPVPPGKERNSPSLAEKLVPLMRGENGEVFLHVNAAAGERKWALVAVSERERRVIEINIGAPPEDARSRVDPSGPGGNAYRYERAETVIGRRLNAVKDLVLDWPEDPNRTHPFLFLSRQELEAVQKRPVDRELLDRLRQQKDIPPVPRRQDSEALAAYLLTGDPQIAAETRLVERLRHHLGLLGHFDKWRVSPVIVGLYDALIDSGLVAPKERSVFRAQMAYLAYELANPYTWSFDRGYCSGNPNMTVGYTLRLGLIACTIPGHPMARTWLQPSMNMMERWLDELGPEGEHAESVANYAHVSADPMLGFAIAAKNARLCDYVNDPRMKKLMLFLAKQYTPPDPRRIHGDTGVSRVPPSGRGAAGQRLGLPGVMARATLDSDPEYSRAQQWVWQRQGYPMLFTFGPLCGYEYAYLDRALPASNPGWGTDLFPAYGVVFRSGLGTAHEYYVNFQVHMRDGWPSTNGSFPLIFAQGAPISTVFVESYLDREELLVSRVLPARGLGTLQQRFACWYHDEERTIRDFASLARQDYTAMDATIKEPRPGSLGAEGKGIEELSCVQMPSWPPVPAVGKPPIAWRRQVLFLKDREAGGAHYLLLRDTVGGGQPTMWQFFTLSDKVGGPAEAADRERFLADKPGERSVEPRELKGDRFTAVGQFGVDLEYYVASPRDTPRHTLRCGENPRFGYPVWQDLLHLQMPGDGAYFVALFPRRRGEPVPSFEALGNGMIIKVSGEFGTDHGFLSGAEAEAAAGDVRFKGTAGSVQDRPSGLVLSLGAKGEVRYKAYGLTAGFAASLRAGEKTLTIEIQDKVTDGDKTRAPQVPFRGGTVTITAPGEWAPAKPLPGVELAQTAAGWTLTVPAGVRSVQLSNR
jgi:hypothetical protein